MKKTQQCITLGKNFICLVFFVISVASVAGCSRYPDRIRQQKSMSVQEHTDEVMNQVLEVLNAHDADKLTNIFSEGVKSDVSNLSDMSEEALKFYCGTGKIVESRYLMTEKKSERGTISIAGTSYYIVETEEETYFILIVMYDRNDFDESMEGLYLLQITTEDFYNQEGFKCENKDSAPGIYIQDVKADEYIPTGDLLEKENK